MAVNLTSRKDHTRCGCFIFSSNLAAKETLNTKEQLQHEFEPGVPIWWQ